MGLYSFKHQMHGFLVIQEEYKGSDIAEKCINASIIF